VTGLYDLSRHSRQRPGITGQSRHFLTERTGYDRLRPATTRQGLCSTRVVARLPHQATAVAAALENANRTAAPPGDHRPSPNHLLLAATGRNAQQRFWPDFAVFGTVAFVTGCHRLRPLGSTRAPSLPEPRERDRSGAGAGSGSGRAGAVLARSRRGSRLFVEPVGDDRPRPRRQHPGRALRPRMLHR
jgi:hypothetical protein